MRQPDPDPVKKTIPLVLLAALILIGGAAGCRSKPPADIPGEFTFHGVAIHPAAVRALYRGSTGQIDLAAFKTNLEARQWEDQPGWWVTDFEENLATGRSPFFAYAAFAAPTGGGTELYVLSITFNEGEPADVDNIVLLQKTGNWLGLVHVWDEGSACNGGILNERMEEDKFFYSRDLTPVDLLGLALETRLDLTANQDLETTSQSCFATANYVYSVTEDREDLISVRLYDEPVQDEKGHTEKFRFQSCFNRVFNDYLTKGKTTLLAKDVEEFAARFKAECLSPGGAAPQPAIPDK